MELSVGIHQPNYFPWLGYFCKIKLSDYFIFLDTVDIQTGSASSLTNRTKIKTIQGEQFLTVPLRKGSSKHINDIIIDNAQPWRKKQLNSLFLAYKKANYFNEIYDLVEKIVSEPFEKLVDLNCAGILRICQYLEIGKSFTMASQLQVTEEDRNLRLILLCKEFKGNIYLSGAGAKAYIDENLFSTHGVNVVYTNFQPKPYPQLYRDFVSKLGIIDVLMNNGKDTVNLLK